MVVLYSKLKISANYVVSPCIWNSLSQVAAHLPLLHSGLSSDRVVPRNKEAGGRTDRGEAYGGKPLLGGLCLSPQGQSNGDFRPRSLSCHETHMAPSPRPSTLKTVGWLFPSCHLKLLKKCTAEITSYRPWGPNPGPMQDLAPVLLKKNGPINKAGDPTWVDGFFQQTGNWLLWAGPTVTTL